jgi:DNA-binding transcriptional ArsR family regulator
MPKRAAVKPIMNVDDPRYVKALAHPLRIRILALLEERDASPVQLAQLLDATLGTVAYHVRTLEQLGLIKMVATHQRRGATEHVYAAREHPRVSDDAWSNTSPLAKQVVLAAALAQVGAYATRSANAGGFDRRDAHLTRTALKLDEKGWSAMATASKRWLQQIQKIEQETGRRVERTGEPVFDAGVVIMLFEAKPFFDTAASDRAAKTPATDGEASRTPRRARSRRIPTG